MAQLLACPNCNAPLPPPAASFVTCTYCGATAAIAHGVATRVQNEQALRVQPATAPAIGTSPRERASNAFNTVMAQRGGVERALLHAANELALASQDGVSAQEMTTGALALARWFDKQNKTKLVEDGMALQRLLEGYRKAVVELRAVHKTTINLPFLTVSKEGIPLHFDREVDAPTIAALLQGR